MTVSSTRHQDGNRKPNARRGSTESRNRFESSALPPILFHLPNLSEESRESPDDTETDGINEDEVGATETPQDYIPTEAPSPEVTEIMVDSGTATPGPSLLEQLGTHAVVFGLLALVVTGAYLYGQQDESSSHTDTLIAESVDPIVETATIEETTVSAAALALTEIDTPEFGFEQPKFEQPNLEQPKFEQPQIDTPTIVDTKSSTRDVHELASDAPADLVEPVAEVNAPPETPKDTELLAEADSMRAIESLELADATPTTQSLAEADSIVANDLEVTKQGVAAKTPGSPDPLLQLKAPTESLAATDPLLPKSGNSTATSEEMPAGKSAETANSLSLSEPVATLQPPRTKGTALTGPSPQPSTSDASLENNLDALAEQVDQLQKVAIEPTAKVASSLTEPKITPASTRNDSLDQMAQGQITIPNEPVAMEPPKVETPVAGGATEIKNYYSRTPRPIQDWTRYFPIKTR